MAQIFNTRGGSQVPSLSQAVAPTLDIPSMKFNTVASALDSYATQQTNDVANAEENFNNLSEFHDQLIGEKFDTQRQKDTFEKARKEVGIGDNAFNISLNDLRDNYKMRDIRSKVGQVYDRNDVQNIFMEQKRSQDYLDKIYNLKDMNPALYKKALSKYNQYRNGDVSGFNLLPQEFQPIDVTSTIAESLKLIPQIQTSDIQTKDGLAYEQIVKQRSKTAIKSVIDKLNSNAAFKNNLEAMFTDQSGNYNEKAANAYIDQLSTEYAKQQIDIDNIKELKQPAVGVEKSITNLMDDVVRRGGDANELLKNKAILQQAVAGKKINLIDEDDSSVNISFMTPDGLESTISIPKIGNSTNPVKYHMNMNGDSKSVTGFDVKSYIQANPKVSAESGGIFGLDNYSTNNGNPTKGYFKDGNFYTNDVKMLWDLKLVPKGTDYEDLDKYGFKTEKKEGGDTMFSIPVTSDKVNVNPPEVYVPNNKDIESKLDSNPVISKYPKDSEKYNIAKMFLASPEIQDGFLKDVYLNGEYKNYLDSVKTVAPLQDNGYFDISNVNESLKPLLKDNTEEKLQYLAHHHAYNSAGFLEYGKSRIEGNPNADTEVKDAWKRIDTILKETPGLDFPELLKKVESNNDYSAVYSGGANSSAIGKYQILFDTHYDDIKNYIMENLDKIPKDLDNSNDKSEESTDSGPDNEANESTTSTSPIFEDFKDATATTQSNKKVEPTVSAKIEPSTKVEPTVSMKQDTIPQINLPADNVTGLKSPVVIPHNEPVDIKFSVTDKNSPSEKFKEQTPKELHDTTLDNISKIKQRANKVIALQQAFDDKIITKTELLKLIEEANK